MTVQEAISQLDEKQHNVYSREDKLRWLAELDSELWEILRHTGKRKGEFDRYNADTLPDTPLLVSAPHDRIYRYWLEAQVDYANQEYTRFNNAIALFGKYYGAFVNWCLRTGTIPETTMRYY